MVVTMLRCQFQNMDTAKLQFPRQEHSYVAGSKIGALLSCKLQESNIAKLQVARETLLSCKLQDRNIVKLQVQS